MLSIAVIYSIFLLYYNMVYEIFNKVYLISLIKNKIFLICGEL